MQELKESVRNNIIAAAITEFLKDGYDRTSIRSISKRSGITHGNIYRYFQNKEVLYSSIVNGSKIALFSVLKNTLTLLDFNGNVPQQIHELAIKLAGIVFDHEERLLLLLEKGPHEHTRKIESEIIRMISAFFMDHLAVSSAFEDDFFIYLSSANIYHGFLEIARTNKNKDWTIKNMELLLRYHLFGLSNFNS